MKNYTGRWLGFIAATAFVAAGFAFGCGGGGGGGGSNPPPEGPASSLDKVVLSFATPSSVSTKALGDYESDYTHFATSLMNDKFSQIAPEAVSSLGLAPNGDFWFINDMGIFVSNVNSSEQKARMLISSEQLAKGFIDSSTEGLYKLYGYPSQISFVTTDQDKGSYVGAFSYVVSADTNSEQGMNYHTIVLRYDSDKGEFTQILKQLSTSAKTGSELYHIYFYKNSFLYSKAFSKDQTYFHFIVSDPTYYNEYAFKLSPDAEKIYFIGIYYDETHMRFSGYDGETYFTNNSTELAALNCEQTNCPPYPDNQSAMTLVANCVNNAIKDSYVTMYKANTDGEDVTSSASSASALITKAKELTASPKLVEAFKVKASYFDNVTYDDPRMYYEYSRCYFNNSYSLDIETARASTNYTFDASRLRLDPAKEGYFFITDWIDGSMEIFYQKFGGDTPTKIFNFAEGSSIITTKATYSSSLGDILLFDLRTYGYDSYGYMDYNQYTDQVYIYSATKAKLVELTDPDSTSDLASFIEIEQNIYNYDYGFTRDGEHLLYSAIENDITNYYFLKTADIFPTGEDQTPASPILAVEGIQGARLILIWKDAALWSLDSAVYMNYPFSADRKAVKLDEVTGKKYIGFNIATVVNAPLPDDLGLDISADFSAAYKCGADGKFATYCSGVNEMCVNKACKSISLSECTKNEDCKDTNLCDNGLCKYTKCYGHSDCPLGGYCPYATYCKSLDHADECYENSQCYTYSSSTSYTTCHLDETVGYMRCLTSCNSSDDCEQGKVCSDYVCIDDTSSDDLGFNECDDQNPCDSNYICVKNFKTDNTNIYDGKCSQKSCNICVPTSSKLELNDAWFTIGQDTISLNGEVNIWTPECLSKYAFCNTTAVNITLTMEAIYEGGWQGGGAAGMRIVDAANSPKEVDFIIENIPAGKTPIDLRGKAGLAGYVYGEGLGGEYISLTSSPISNPHCMATGNLCPTGYTCSSKRCVQTCAESSQCTGMPCVNSACVDIKPTISSVTYDYSQGTIFNDLYTVHARYTYTGNVQCKMYTKSCANITQSSTPHNIQASQSGLCTFSEYSTYDRSKGICIIVAPYYDNTFFWNLKVQKDVTLQPKQ